MIIPSFTLLLNAARRYRSRYRFLRLFVLCGLHDSERRMEKPFRLYRGWWEAAIQGKYCFGGAKKPQSFLLDRFSRNGEEWLPVLIIWKSWIFMRLLLWCQVVLPITAIN